MYINVLTFRYGYFRDRNTTGIASNSCHQGHQNIFDTQQCSGKIHFAWFLSRRKGKRHNEVNKTFSDCVKQGSYR